MSGSSPSLCCISKFVGENATMVLGQNIGRRIRTTTVCQCINNLLDVYTTHIELYSENE